MDEQSTSIPTPASDHLPANALMQAKSVDLQSIQKAVDLLNQGQLVAFPTETVYGLGADASSDQSLKRLYEAKGRPSDHPVIVHVGSLAQVADWAVNLPDCLGALANAFWPGPLTVVLQRAPHVLNQVTGGQNTVAVRIPAHPVALDLLRAFAGGLAAPSANRFGRLSPTTAQDVERELGGEVALVLDGGPCYVGIESTILDLSDESKPRILRPGMLLRSQIEAVLGKNVLDPKTALLADGASPRVPGALPAHYAPRTPLILVHPRQLAEPLELPVEALKTTKTEQNLAHHLAADHTHVPSGKSVCILSFQQKPETSDWRISDWRQAPSDAEHYARDLYSALRYFDSLGADLILVEEPPNEPNWSGVRDRLGRASYSRQSDNGAAANNSSEPAT